METIAISEFKAHALKIIDNISKNHEKIIITKRGKPVAEIIPYRSSEGKSKPGKLAGTLIYKDDIVSPLGEEMWDASK